MARAQPYKYFDPEQAAQLGKLNLIARTAVEGFVTGLHRSPHHGFSVEFSEHREYTPGDDLRHLDWVALARTDRYYVKRYEQETNLRAHILLDVSGSMDYGTGATTKFDYGCRLAAMIAYLMTRQQDMVGLVAFDQAIRKHLPPGSTPTHLDRLFTSLEEITPGNVTAVSRTFHDLAEKIARRGLIIIISDLYDDPGEVMKALRHFRHKKHQVIVFHVFDQAELDLPFNKLMTFVDMETQEKLQIDPKFIRHEYKRQVDAFVSRYRRDCSDSAIEYILASTATPYDVMLRGYLASRQATGGRR
ncbi:MAG: DUF58 domain-containing protein [Phycisphaerae bacterium]|nr:DUF58 domain-containing protein [Phycisphaerae bacterium]